MKMKIKMEINEKHKKQDCTKIQKQENNKEKKKL